MKGKNVPYQKYCDDGYFKVKYTEKYGITYPYTLITPKGMDYIVKKIRSWNMIDKLIEK